MFPSSWPEAFCPLQKSQVGEQKFFQCQPLTIFITLDSRRQEQMGPVVTPLVLVSGKILNPASVTIPGPALGVGLDL